VVIERDGVPRPLDFVLIREDIQVKNVTYAGMVADGIGYVRLERFSRRAGDELRQAIKELKLNADVKGLVLDLRGNPGGLLDAAVDVVSKFVPRGSLVVSTRGRRVEADKKYYSTEEPLLASMPLVVLTDRNSASASEIVAGSLQDLDRALIVGTRTFGKGLVQTIVPLNYGAQLKITTARYYIPSGRSIQEIDYIHRDRNGIFTVTPDSLRREFKTVHGRTVFELGGITPDSTVEPHDHGPMVKELIRKSLFFRFANRYVNEHKADSITGITPALLDAFRSYLEKEKFDFEEESEKDVADLKKRAEGSMYSKEVLDGIDRLTKSLEKEKARSFERYQKHLEEELLIELMARMHGDRGRIEASFTIDTQLKIAIELVRNAKAYSRMLHG
jgi:carboxyl-terminal processing protease